MQGAMMIHENAFRPLFDEVMGSSMIPSTRESTRAGHRGAIDVVISNESSRQSVAPVVYVPRGTSITASCGGLRGSVVGVVVVVS